MPVQVQGPDGNTYQFPDGTDKAGAIAYFKKKGIGGKTPAAQPSAPGDWRDPLTRIEPHQPVRSASDLGREVVRGVGNIGAGGLGVLLRPISTIESVGNLYLHPSRTAHELGEQLYEQPLETVESMVGQAGATAGVGAVAGRGARSVGKILPRTARAVSGTSPKVVGDLVKETQKENVGIAEANKELGQQHLEKTQSALHETEGRELLYRRDVKAAEDTAREKQAQLDREHDAAVQEALHENQGRELAYQQELSKAKLESEEAYQEKLRDVDAKRRKAEVDRRKELRKYMAARDKVQSDYQKAVEEHKSAAEKQAKIAPTQSKLRSAVSNLRAGVETAREKALKVGNSKYSGVNTALNGLASSLEFIGSALGDAETSLRGATQDTTLLKDMQKEYLPEHNKDGSVVKGREGRVPRYEDLQGDYSRLGRELTKGTLSGDVFHAYDVLHEAIGNEMQRLADSKGQGVALTDARNYWRRMKQTFGKLPGESDAATKTLKDAGGNLITADEQANRIRLLGSFDPDLPGLFQHVENLKTGVGALPEAEPARKGLTSLIEARKPTPSLPQKQAPIPEPEPVEPRAVQQPLRVPIPDRPGTVLPKLPAQPERVAPPDRPEYAPAKTIGTPEIESAKLKSLQGRAKAISHYTARAAMYVTGYRSLVAIGRAMTGDVGALAGLPADIAEGAAVVAGGQAFAAFLENPKIAGMLTRATAADVAQIPPELRGNLGGIVQAAQKQGIKVSPALIAATAGSVGGQPRKRVAAALKP